MRCPALGGSEPISERMTLDQDLVDRYLDRIGTGRPPAPTMEALRDLHLRHLMAVPFENLSIHLGQPIVLGEQALLHKIVHERRGGFCYELNGAFAALLGALGFPVALLSASVYAEQGLNPPFDHLALAVEADGRWLADVGFGDHSLHPLSLETSGPQVDPAGTFEVAGAGEDAYDVLRDGEPRYRFWAAPRALPDFAARCQWHQSAPESEFLRTPVCTMVVPGGRATLSGRHLIRTMGAKRTETVLGDDKEVLAAYRDIFGITLQTVPESPAGEGE